VKATLSDYNNTIEKSKVRKGWITFRTHIIVAMKTHSWDK